MTTIRFRIAPFAFMALALAAPVAAQSGNQSDVTGVNTTSSGTSIAPAPLAPVSPSVVSTITQSLAAGTFTVDGVVAPPAVQAALADILSGNVQTPAVTVFTDALGPAGTLVAESLAAFAQSPTTASLNAAIDAFNTLLDGASPAVIESPEFQTTYGVLTTLRAVAGAEAP